MSILIIHFHSLFTQTVQKELMDNKLSFQNTFSMILFETVGFLFFGEKKQ